MKRIQLKRTKGYRKPEGAVNVTRSTKWGNPFKVGEPIRRYTELAPYVNIPGGWRRLVSVNLRTNDQVVDAYFWWILEQPHLMIVMKDELAGHDLACYCPPDKACHADVLIELCEPL